MGNAFFYSERGLINCLVLDLKNNLDKTREFLRLIKFGTDEKTTEWLDKVLSVDWYIEFSASEFGNPDLIADINCTDGHRVIFFEAKLKSYEKAAVQMDMNQPFDPQRDVNYDPQKDGIYKNKSSSINAQLALRYRLAQTLKLSRWQEIRSKLLNSDEPRIEESYDDAISYHDMFKAIHESKTGRRIHNRRMIAVLDKLMQNNPDFYFVAMTFETSEHIFKSIQNNDPNLLPPLGITKWNSVNRQFGLLNFNDLKNSIQPDDNSYLWLSRDYINFNSQDGAEDPELMDDSYEEEQQNAEREELSSKDRYQQKGLPNAHIYSHWYDLLQDIAGNQFKDYKTSCSIVKEGKTIAKLMYKNDDIYLGFRDKLPDGLNKSESITINIQTASFIGILAEQINTDLIIGAVKSIL